MTEHLTAQTLPSSGHPPIAPRDVSWPTTEPSNSLTDGWILEVGLEAFMGERYSQFAEEFLRAESELATTEIETLPEALKEIAASLRDKSSRVNWHDLIQ